MIVNGIYHGATAVQRVYHAGEIIFQTNPVEFHVIEDDKLIIVGAYSAREFPDGVYLDCNPDWIFPVQNGNVLYVRQVYGATQNGNVLEVK